MRGPTLVDKSMLAIPAIVRGCSGIKYNDLVAAIQAIVPGNQSAAAKAVSILKKSGHLHVAGHKLGYTWTDEPSVHIQHGFSRTQRSANECQSIKTNPDMWTSLHKVGV